MLTSKGWSGNNTPFQLVAREEGLGLPLYLLDCRLVSVWVDMANLHAMGAIRTYGIAFLHVCPDTNRGMGTRVGNVPSNPKPSTCHGVLHSRVSLARATVHGRGIVRATSPLLSLFSSAENHHTGRGRTSLTNL